MMPSGRLEALTDGVIAIIITIMVLELRPPANTTWSSLGGMTGQFAAYVLSFVFLGIYWNNHHHLFQVTERISGSSLWANLHLLFWLSLVPFTTSWLAETGLEPVPVAAYGLVLLFAGVAWMLLQASIFKLHPEDSMLRTAIGRDLKGKVSGLAYAVAVPLAFVDSWISVAIYVLVAGLWLVPDRRIESRLSGRA